MEEFKKKKRDEIRREIKERSHLVIKAKEVK